MSKYEFAASVFNTRREWAVAVATAYLTAFDRPRAAVISGALERTAQEMAEEAVHGYGLDIDDELYESLIEAFEAIKANPSEYFDL